MKKNKYQITKQTIKNLILVTCIIMMSCSGEEKDLMIDTTTDEGAKINEAFNKLEKQKQEKIENYKKFLNERPKLRNEKRYDRLYNQNSENIDEYYLMNIETEINTRKANENLITKYKKQDKTNFKLDELKKMSTEDIETLKYINQEIDKLSSKYKLEDIKEEDPYFSKDDQKIVESIKKESYAKQKDILKKFNKRNILIKQILNGGNQIYTIESDVNNKNKFIKKDISDKKIFDYENARKFEDTDSLEDKLNTVINDLESISFANKEIKTIFDNKYLADPATGKFYDDPKDDDSSDDDSKDDDKDLKLNLLKTMGTNTKERMQQIKNPKNTVSLVKERGEIFNEIVDNPKYKLTVSKDDDNDSDDDSSDDDDNDFKDDDDKDSDHDSKDDDSDDDNDYKGITKEKLMAFIPRNSYGYEKQIKVLKLIIEANNKGKVNLIKASKEIIIRTFKFPLVDFKNKLNSPNSNKFYSEFEKFANKKNIFAINKSGKNSFNFNINNLFTDAVVNINFYKDFFKKLFNTMEELYELNKDTINNLYDQRTSTTFTENFDYSTSKNIIKSLLKLKIKDIKGTSFIEKLDASYKKATTPLNKKKALKNLIDYLEENGYKDESNQEAN